MGGALQGDVDSGKGKIQTSGELPRKKKSSGRGNPHQKRDKEAGL